LFLERSPKAIPVDSRAVSSPESQYQLCAIANYHRLLYESFMPNDGKPQLPHAVQELVARFDRNREAYKSSNYNETQVRREFIDPLFKALGWDIDNQLGHAEAYKDVVHEDAIKVGDGVRAPDYCFRIGGTRKFFLEAKKPSIDIKNDASPAFQLRRYAWTTKLPLSILTDFEEFAVYDCRVKPDQKDKASVARILYIPYTEYQTRWDEIESVFSRDAVLKGSFDKYAESNKVKRGTAPVDDAFLQTIENWRKELAENLALRNRKLTQREVNFAVQRIIDRIIFLRICEGRGIEDYGRLRALADSDRIYPRLGELFAEADDRYNSGLFHFKAEQGRHEPPDSLTLRLELDDKLLRGILKGLYYPESPYVFSALPADVLGQVYEQFLGKVIRLTEGHHAKVEDKPEVKKAGGVYYTPTYIVDYIVQNTVGKLLEGKTQKQAAALKILDPACGSGSFLLGAYEYLLKWHLDFYTKNDPSKFARGSNPVLVQASGGGWRLTIAERKRILLANIYGVDIDAQAVETTKLSLLLKVLEGETQQTLQPVLRAFQERALPDLGDNIKCGNSLIAPDFYRQQLLPLDEEDRYRINVFDWEHEFSDIFHGGGFDAVIGNPPYGAYLFSSDKDYLNSKFHAQTYQLDSYLLFLEKSVNELLKAGGLYGMIIPNPWLTNLLQTTTRRFVVERTRVQEIVHFRFPVFPKVVVDTEIVILQKGDPKGTVAKITIAESLPAFLVRPWSAGVKQMTHKQEKWRKLNGGVINIFTNTAEEALARKCVAAGRPLEEFCKINVGIKPYQVGKGQPPQTRSTVENRPFDAEAQKNNTYRAYLRGSDVGRYLIAPLQPRFLRYGPWLAEPRPAANFDAPVKIVMRQTGDSLIASLDSQRYLCLNNMHVLVPFAGTPSPKVLLGIINSRLMNWYYQVLNPEAGEALAEVKKSNVARLPIRSFNMLERNDKSAHDHIVRLVDHILDSSKRLPEARTPQEKTSIERQITATDKQIDSLVYELYGLTSEEIGIVESSR
jgi:type I restriction-modification system DNA methylase subunit